ncbi:MAG: heavy-metal-associated domain-containing protein [Pseudonocardia sp.]
MTAILPTDVRTDPATVLTTLSTTVLTIGGMHCGNCVRHVQEALGEIAGVTAEVDLDTATVVVRHPADVTVAQLLDAIDEAGYEVTVREAPAQGDAAREAGAR